ncbi:alkaline phosphatase D family protein [Williamsia sp. 1135]|uniref:alkaline phosphatase D family protein n=1 Tax=Williamsia sp. 1135 TaxID=1889262 RepID=UPI001F0A2E76|nr:alkaline phosphatase D family protein [Williamsia sp. 1135]
MNHGDHLFTLGVASGDPLPDAVVLWTRLASAPLAPHGGMTDIPIPVEWELALDSSFRRVLKRGIELATPADGHSVHVDVRGLEPASDYFYRFRAAGHISDVGRTRTAPPTAGTTRALTFAWASCQSWGDGFFNAYADMAAAAPDVVFHLGDYVYEKAIPTRGGQRNTTALPQSAHSEMTSLDDYRERYALYKLDPHLQQAHRTSPFIVTMDDHEVENNWAAGISEDSVPVPDFLYRRASAFKAWWENTPVRAELRPNGADMRIYRRFTFGDIAQFSVLDTRQYRSDQVNGDTDGPQNDFTARSDRTITGAAQQQWLLDGLASSTTRWNVLAHQTTIADLARTRNGARAVSMDGWSGYEASRTQILDGARERGVGNLVSIVGDIHRSVVSELKSTYTRPATTVGVELAGTSISSGGDGADSDESDKLLKAASPHVKFGNSQRGYVLNRLTHRDWQAEFRVADSVADPGAGLRRRATVRIPDGRPDIEVDEFRR